MTLESAQAYALIILASVGGLGSLVGAIFAGMATLRTGRVEKKTDHAIQQNNEIGGKVDGNLTKIWETVHGLQSIVEKLATQTPTVVAPIVAEPRQVRAEDLRRTKAAGEEAP